MICVDASVAAKWLFPETYSDQALSLVTQAVAAKERIIAPSLLPIEITNIIRQRIRQGILNLDQAKDELGRFYSFRVSTNSSRLLHRRALIVADQYNIPSAYDAHYVALAELTGATFWTSDERLIRLLADKVSYVRWIADYSA